MAREKGLTLGVWDRLMAASGSSNPNHTVQPMTLEQVKSSVARDLEALLNTRVAISEEKFSLYPRCRTSVLNYGVRDFAAMCLTSSEDRKIICDYLKVAIQCYEPRLKNVRAKVVMEPGVMNRLDFVIFGNLDFPGAAGRVEFNATLQPSTLHYSITPSGRRATPLREAA